MQNAPPTSRKNYRGSETVLYHACNPDLPCRRGSHERESCEGSLVPLSYIENRVNKVEQTVKRGSNFASGPPNRLISLNT